MYNTLQVVPFYVANQKPNVSTIDKLEKKKQSDVFAFIGVRTSDGGCLCGGHIMNSRVDNKIKFMYYFFCSFFMLPECHDTDTTASLGV